MIKTLADQISKWLKESPKENEIPSIFVFQWQNWYQPGQIPELVNKTLEIQYLIVDPVNELDYMDNINLSIGSPTIKNIRIHDLDNNLPIDYDNLGKSIQEIIVAEIWKDYQKTKFSK